MWIQSDWGREGKGKRDRRDREGGRRRGREGDREGGGRRGIEREGEGGGCHSHVFG